MKRVRYKSTEMFAKPHPIGFFFTFAQTSVSNQSGPGFRPDVTELATEEPNLQPSQQSQCIMSCLKKSYMLL